MKTTFIENLYFMIRKTSSIATMTKELSSSARAYLKQLKNSDGHQTLFTAMTG